MSARDFNWYADDSPVVLRAYGSIAVHENELGDVVIRQERDALEDEDHFVVVPVQDAELIAKAIVDKAKEIKRGWVDQRPPQQPAAPEAQSRLALPAPHGKPATVPPNGSGTGTATKAGVA
jgi:hypothetical protein